MGTYLNLSQAADLLAELTKNSRIKEDIVRIIMLGAEGEIPIFWRNSLHIWTSIFSHVELLPRDELEPLPGTEASPNWLQIDHFALCDLELYQQTECWTFQIDTEDVLSLMQRGELLFTDLGLEKWVRHQVDCENVTIDRNQLFVLDHNLKDYAASLMPDDVVSLVQSAPGVAVIDQVQPRQAAMSVLANQAPGAATVNQREDKKSTWWQIEHPILELAQNIGQKIHDQNEKILKKDRFATSNRKISEVIASRIKSIESKKAYPRDDCPDWETVRKVSLTGWKFTPK